MLSVETRKELTREQRIGLLGVLKGRFEKNMDRHKDVEWTEVQPALCTVPGGLPVG